MASHRGSCASKISALRIPPARPDPAIPLAHHGFALSGPRLEACRPHGPAFPPRASRRGALRSTFPSAP
jgi:hypothetical protein